MKKDTLDDFTDQILKEENPTAEAVKSLINVEDREKGKASSVELKTDLTPDEIKIHTVLDTLSNALEMNPIDFNKNCILSSVIERKERKSLSKNRMSRTEIVQVARQPDMNFTNETQEKAGFIKRMFMPRKRE